MNSSLNENKEKVCDDKVFLQQDKLKLQKLFKHDICMCCGDEDSFGQMKVDPLYIKEFLQKSFTIVDFRVERNIKEQLKIDDKIHDIREQIKLGDKKEYATMVDEIKQLEIQKNSLDLKNLYSKINVKFDLNSGIIFTEKPKNEWEIFNILHAIDLYYELVVPLTIKDWYVQGKKIYDSDWGEQIVKMPQIKFVDKIKTESKIYLDHPSRVSWAESRHDKLTNKDEETQDLDDYKNFNVWTNYIYLSNKIRSLDDLFSEYINNTHAKISYTLTLDQLPVSNPKKEVRKYFIENTNFRQKLKLTWKSKEIENIVKWMKIKEFHEKYKNEEFNFYVKKLLKWVLISWFFLRFLYYVFI